MKNKDKKNDKVRLKPNSDALSSSSLEDVISSFANKQEDVELCLEPLLDDKKMIMYAVLGSKQKIVKPLLTQRSDPKKGTDLFKIAQWAKEIGFNRITVNPVVSDEPGKDFLLNVDLNDKNISIGTISPNGEYQVFKDAKGEQKKYKNYFRFIDSVKRVGFSSVSISSIDLKKDD